MPASSTGAVDPADLDSFWADTLRRARIEPLNAKAEQLDGAHPVWQERITYPGFGGVPLRAYFSRPREDLGSRKLPAIITSPGYGGFKFGTELSEALRGYAILQVYPRSQGESAELWSVPPAFKGNWLGYKAEHREGYYYQGAYMDLVRGLDYLVSRPEVDPERIGVIGMSQSGGMALALAALDTRIKVAAAHVPFLCDLRHNPHWHTAMGAQQEKILEVFASFDALTLAPRVKAPTLVSSGGKDIVCPPHTIQTVYEKLAGVKAHLHYPDLQHTPSQEYYRMQWQWIDQYLS